MSHVTHVHAGTFFVTPSPLALEICACNTCEHILSHYVRTAHCTRCGDPQWMWTSGKKRLNTLAATLQPRKKSRTTRDEAHTGPTWRYGSQVVRVRRDVTRFKTCDTLPVRDTLTPFTGGQVFRVKRDVIRHTDKFKNPLLNQIV